MTKDKEALEKRRARERTALNHFVTWVIGLWDQGLTDLEVYWEWPHLCSGWNVEALEKQGRSWLAARIDGCRFGMRNAAGTEFIRKQWRVMTSDVVFAQEYKYKICQGNHRHATIEGSETNRTSYYPVAMVRSIAQLLAPKAEA